MQGLGKGNTATARDSDKTWKKEDELKGLKSELAALDRKIQLELAPPQPATEEDKNELKKQQTNEKEIEHQPPQRVYTSRRL